MTRLPLLEGKPCLILWPRGRALGCEATLRLEAGSVTVHSAPGTPGKGQHGVGAQ